MSNSQRSPYSPPVLFLAKLSGVAAATFLGAWLAIYSAGGVGNPSSVENADALPIVLKADTANSGKAITVSTGLIDEGVEGLFILDHLSGNLQCWVMNPQTGGVAAMFLANPATDMGIAKGGDTDFVMCTGGFIYQGRGRRTGNLRPASCICYVADGNSGKVVGYSLLYDRQAALKGGTQEGSLEVVCRGVARGEGLIRDQ